MNDTAPRAVAPLAASEVVLRLLNPFTGIAGLMTEALNLSHEASSLELAVKTTRRETNVRVVGVRLAAKVAIATLRQRALRNLQRIRQLQVNIRANRQQQQNLIRLISRATIRMVNATTSEEAAAMREVIASAAELLRRDAEGVATRLRRLLAMPALTEGRPA